MGGHKEGVDCWRRDIYKAYEKARERASGRKKRRKELIHILIKTPNFCKQQAS